MSYEITGNRHMGASMKKKQALINEWKLKSRRKIMPGYPIEKPFETREQVDTYLNVDRLVCLLCGKTYKSLGNHLSVHGTNADDYKEKYGLPWGCGLTCITTKVHNVKHGKRLVADGIFRPPTKEQLEEMRIRRAKPRAKAIFIIDECKARVHGKQVEKIYTEIDYLNILEEAIKNDCHPTDVCRKNKGLAPSLTMLHKYKREHPGFRKQYDDIIEKLPSRVRMAHGISDKDNIQKIKYLKSQRKTNAEIGIILGIHENTVEKYNKKHKIQKPPPTTCRSGLHPYPGLRTVCQPCATLASRKYHGTMDRNISKTIMIDRQCTDCGVTVKVTRLYGTKKTKYCEACKIKRYHASQGKYAREKRHLL
jgi:hypothetical protein